MLSSCSYGSYRILRNSVSCFPENIALVVVDRFSAEAKCFSDILEEASLNNASEILNHTFRRHLM